MLRSLLHSKHPPIAQGAAAAMKNLLGSQSTSLSSAMTSAVAAVGGLPPSGRLLVSMFFMVGQSADGPSNVRVLSKCTG